MLKESNRAQIKPEALWECDQAQACGAAQFMAASTVRTQFHEAMLRLFERCDFLTLPSAQVWPFDASERWPCEIAGRAMDSYHRWMEVELYATFTGLQCISVPTGFGVAGLHMDLQQLIGRPPDDAGVLRLTVAYETAIGDWLARRPGLLEYAPMKKPAGERAWGPGWARRFSAGR